MFQKAEVSDIILRGSELAMTDGTHCSKAKALQIKKLNPKWIPSVEDIKSPRALVVDGWKGDG